MTIETIDIAAIPSVFREMMWEMRLREGCRGGKDSGGKRSPCAADDRGGRCAGDVVDVEAEIERQDREGGEQATDDSP